MRIFIALLIALLLHQEALSSVLVGVTAGDIKNYIPELNVIQTKNITRNSQVDIKIIKEKYNGDIGKWENEQELRAGSVWSEIAGKECGQSRYIALTHIRRHFLVVGQLIFFQMSTDLVCAD